MASQIGIQRNEVCDGILEPKFPLYLVRQVILELTRSRALSLGRLLELLRLVCLIFLQEYQESHHAGCLHEFGAVGTRRTGSVDQA